MPKQNKKFSLIFVIFVLLPVALLVLNGHIAEKGISDWSVENRNQVSFLTLLIVVISAIYLIAINFIKKSHSIFWYIIAFIFLILSIVFLLLGTAVVNFGF